MNTHQSQLRADIERIDAEFPTIGAEEEAGMRYAERSGRFGALAHYYAGCADFEAAQRQRLGRDPKAFIAVFTSQIGGPSAADIASLLYELHDYLRLRPELEDAMFTVEQAAHACEYEARQEQERAEEAEEAELARLNAARENLIERGIVTC